MPAQCSLRPRSPLPWPRLLVPVAARHRGHTPHPDDPIGAADTMRLPARRPIAVRWPHRRAPQISASSGRPPTRPRWGQRDGAALSRSRTHSQLASPPLPPPQMRRRAAHRLLMRREPLRGPLPFDRLQNAPAIASGRAGTGSMDCFGPNQPAQAVIRSLGRSFKGWARCGGPITRAWWMGQGAARVCRGLEVSLLVALLVRTSPAAIALPPERRLPHNIAKQVSRVVATTSGVSTLPWVSGNPGIIILH